MSTEESVNNPFGSFGTQDLCELAKFGFHPSISNDGIINKNDSLTHQKRESYCNLESSFFTANSQMADLTKSIGKQEEKCLPQERTKKLKLKKPRSKHCIINNEESYQSDKPDRIAPKNDLEVKKNIDKVESCVDNVLTDSSWCDLSDCSVTSVILNPFGCGDAGKQGKYQPSNKNSMEIPSKLESGKTNL